MEKLKSEFSFLSCTTKVIDSIPEVFEAAVRGHNGPPWPSLGKSRVGVRVGLASTCEHLQFSCEGHPQVLCGGYLSFQTLGVP